MLILALILVIVGFGVAQDHPTTWVGPVMAFTGIGLAAFTAYKANGSVVNTR